MESDETDEMEFEDKFAGEEIMEQKEEEKYLDDVISMDGKNIKNTKDRFAKGTGIVNKIMTTIWKAIF